ncbi:MAG TPA: ATP-binding protein [Anaerolineales bacterium]|jgi:PAS domain S-box-containing protein
MMNNRHFGFFSLPHLRRDLGIQLLTLYLLLVIPALSAMLIFDFITGKQIQAEVKASDLALTRAIGKETDQRLQNVLSAVESLGKYPAVIASDPQGMGAIFSIVSDSRPDINLIYRLSPAGIMLYHYPPGPGSTVGTDFSFREYYIRALASSRSLMSEGRISPTTNQPVATAVMPIRSVNGEFQGLVAANLRLESLSATLREILAEHMPQESFQIFIIDHSGQIIAHSQGEMILRKVSELSDGLVNLAALENNTSLITPDARGTEYLYTHTTIPSTGWWVVASRPTAAAFAQQIIFHRITLVASLSLALIGGLFWLILARAVILPVEKLSIISQKIGANQPIDPLDQDYLEKSSTRKDQIGNLIASLLRMERSIRERMNEQATLLETSQAVVSSLDSEVVLNRILEQVEKLMKVEKVVIVALVEEAGVFRARASRGLSSNYIEKMTIQPDEPYSVTMRAIRSGEPIQVSDTETDPTFAAQRPRARAEGYRSMLAVPLKTLYTPPSALVVYRPDQHEYTPSEMQLLVSFANHATMAIENAALFARSDTRLQEQTRRIESLIQSLQDGLILGNLRGNVLYANRRISELAGLDPLAVNRMPVSRIMRRILAHAADPATVKKELERALKEADPASVEFSMQDNGRAQYMRAQTFNVTDAQGISLGKGIILKNITADRELDRMKSSLISTVSHELRTPLAAIKGYATTLLADDVEWDRASQREFLEIISNESDRLSGLVNNLLDLSRIELHSLQIERVECNAADLIGRAARRAHLTPGNYFSFEVATNLPPLFADPERLETILRNLIENAVKYAGENAKIRVSVSQREQDFYFFVEDDGPGIPSDQSLQVFESFYRADNSLSRAVGGAGLGLAICQGFVSAHGGKIWIEPRSTGACIAFSIPMLPMVV